MLLCNTIFDLRSSKLHGLVLQHQGLMGLSLFKARDKTVCASKVDMPRSNIATIWTPMFEWYVVGYGSKNRHQKVVFKRDWTMCSKYVDHSKLNSQHTWGPI